MKIPLSHTGQFSKLFLDYVYSMPQLEPFYHLKPEITSFEEKIRNKKFLYRDILATILKKQYLDSGLEIDTSLLRQPNTFTLTTGHQLNIFGGPLYFVYKILTTLKLAKELKSAFPDFNFVPIYWMASEDHDFDEINNINLFGKKIVWSPEKIGGAVGRLKTTHFEPIWEAMPELTLHFAHFYNGSNSLATATRKMVTHFFGDVMVVDGDDKELKSLFAPFMHREIEASQSYSQVLETSAQLQALGYKTQINPRQINLFYLSEFARERIVNEGENFRAGHKIWTKQQMKQELSDQPQNFSPNVVLRPLYQEVILPNLAYVGGPAEIAYWLQLKGVFESAQVDFPVLIPRNFALIIPKSQSQKMQKLGIKPQDLFKTETELKEAYLKNQSSEDLNFQQERQEFFEIFSSIKAKAKAIDPTLEPIAAAEEQKLIKSLEALEKRLVKSIESRHSQAINQINNIKNKFFPHAVPQERHDNFLNFWLNENDFLNLISNEFEPFDFSYLLLEL